MGHKKLVSSGFSVIELLIAMAIFMLIVPTIATIVFASQKTVGDLELKAGALDLAQSILEGLRFQNSTDFANIKSYNIYEQPYQTTIVVTLENKYTKKVTATVTWGTTGQVALTTILTNPLAGLVDSTCLVEPKGNWLLNGSLNFGSGNVPTDVVSRNNLVYVTTDSATTSADDFFVVNIANPSQPSIMGHLNTGPGLNSLSVAGSYAYVANTSINNQLQIIDISLPSSPVLVKSFKLPGNYSDNTTIGNTITYSDNKVFLGTQKSQIAEFHIIDVTNVLAPTELGTFELGAGINDIVVDKSLAYLASPASEEVTILDVSSPAAPAVAPGFNAPGGSGNGKSLAILEDTLVLGRTLGGKELYLLNARSSPATVISSADLNTSIVRIDSIPNWLYLATTDATKTIQLWNALNTQAPTLGSFYALPGKASALACGTSNLLVTTDNGLFILTP